MSIMKAIQELIQGVADEQIEPHSVVLSAKLTAVEMLLDMLWVNEMAKEEDPLGEAKELKNTVMGSIRHNKDDVDEQLAFECLEERLDSIVYGVRHL